MNHKKSALAITAAYVTIALLFSLRPSRAMTEGPTTRIAGNHPHIAITPQSRPAATDWKLNMEDGAGAAQSG